MVLFLHGPVESLFIKPRAGARGGCQRGRLLFVGLRGASVGAGCVSQTQPATSHRCSGLQAEADGRASAQPYSTARGSGVRQAPPLATATRVGPAS